MNLPRCIVAAIAALGVAAPTAAAQGPNQPDYVASDNVELLTRLKEVQDGVGATIVGDYMYVTSTQSLNIYDIKTDPASPQMVGTFTLNVQFENEEVPTNGKILGISSDTYCVPVDDPTNSGTAASGGCLAIYDVSDPENVSLLKTVPGAGDHTSACALDCTYMYGDGGHITDLREPANATLLETNWIEKLQEQSGLELVAGCHHVREITDGIMLGSCNPVIVFSIRAEDGASPEAPVLLATGSTEDTRFIHSSRWPRKGLDRWVLVGGEANAQPQCSDQVSAFMTWDASQVVNGLGGFNRGSTMTLVDEVRPENGTYTDGHSPYNILGCSVHWFSEHPTFHNGGLVALAEYENGTRFLQVSSDGKLTEQGYFLPLAGSTSAPHWNPHDPSIVYAVDYTRGVDVLRWSGDLYVPDNPTPGATPGTGGKAPDFNGAPCASASGFESVTAKGRGRGLRFDAKVRESSPFTVDVFQQSQGRRVIGERLVARFRNKTRGFSWSGRRGLKGRLSDGNYFARFTMRTAAGARDTRRITLTRSRGRFRSAPPFYQRIDCGQFASLKLSASVYGGSTRAPLGISYKLSAPAQSVSISVRSGGRTLKRFRGGTAAGRTFRFTVPARLGRAGRRVDVIVTATDSNGNRLTPIRLAAKRL